MLLDNAKDKEKVSNIITKHSLTGEMDIVTGYFTIGGLSWFAEKTNERITKFRFILGDIASRDYNQIPVLDLLNSEKSIEQVLLLRNSSLEAVRFLEQDKVEFKTFEPNFCHAKLFLFKTKQDETHNYYITGSSNLTEAGMGLKQANNVELNIYNTGNTNSEFEKLCSWFNDIFENKALSKKTVKQENGKEKQIDFKKYLIDEISKIFKEYTPNEIYLKILAEMGLGAKQEIETTLGRSKIYNALYKFQKAGAASLIGKLEQHNGAILADAVGLGKTWTALAVIKFYQKKGFEVIVICPKKLKNNWLKWKKDFDSRFKEDNFDYRIRFHTDLEEYTMRNKAREDTSDPFFTSEKPKLFVIDESHNLRNSKGKRYNFLLENMLDKNENYKILMLSATPINNSLLDIRNQLKLIPSERQKADGEQNIDYVFKIAQGKFNEWACEENPRVSNLVKELPDNFLRITDRFVVARTREMIKDSGAIFPKWEEPKNYYITPNCIKGCSSFSELLELLPARFSAYMPAFYAKKTDKSVIKDESSRDLFLVKMMHFLLIKRLESSWHSFYKTVENIHNYHKEVLEKIKNYESRGAADGGVYLDVFDDEDTDEEYFELGKKRRIKISEIKNLKGYKNDLQEDTEKLRELLEKLKPFNEELDFKLLKLLEIIKDKPKALIFTAYKDTAEYLHKHISKKFDNAAVVSGSTDTQDMEDILQKFAPLAKFEESKKTETDVQKKDDALQNPVNILVATDVLSEGQNLQDCDFVINYDIHWNPVRVVQRMGRIDRLGSRHEKISYANFWAEKNINEYLGLQARVEKRMVAMKIAGSEIPKEFTDNLQKMNDDKTLEQRQLEKNLKIMQEAGIEEIEKQIFGMQNLTEESFSADLTFDSVERYKNLPNGIFSGFLLPSQTECFGNLNMIAVVKNKKDGEIKLLFVNECGKEILQNEIEILKFLRDSRKLERFIPQKIEECNREEIEKLSGCLNKWFQ